MLPNKTWGELGHPSYLFSYLVSETFSAIVQGCGSALQHILFLLTNLLDSQCSGAQAILRLGFHLTDYSFIFLRTMNDEILIKMFLVCQCLEE